MIDNKFNIYKKQIFLNKFVYSKLFGKKYMVMKYYKKAHGYTYNFDNPKLFTEKINTRKLENNPLYSLCANKLLVRDYIKSKIGEEYLIPILYNTKKLTSKNYNNIPKECVLKTCNGSGTIKVIFDKEKENKDDIIKLMREYQKIDFAYIWGEMFYKKRKNYIICEQLLLDKNGKVPTDYKIHCFRNGNNPKYFIQLEFDRFGNHRRNIYDENFNLLNLTTGLPLLEGSIKKPKNFKKMMNIAKKLSEDFNYVRVDLYNLDGKIYFGELTFTHNAGFTKFDPEIYNQIWGEYIG